MPMKSIEPLSGISRNILGLSLPNILLVLLQSSLLIFEAFYVGIIGDDYLIMLALLMPLYMLMLMIGSGSISAAGSSVVARHLGSNSNLKAKESGEQIVVVGVLSGLLFFSCVVAFCAIARLLFSGLFSAAIPDETYPYAVILFLSAPAIFAFNALSGVMRGAGEMVFPAAVSAVTAVLVVAVTPLVMFGLGSFEGLGLLGVAATLTFFNYLGLLVLARRVFSDDRPFMPVLVWVWRRKVVAELLAVAVPTAILSFLNLSAFVAVTIVMARMGEAGAAAYGVIGRIEFTVMVVSFAVGVAIIREVGVRFGAGDLVNAKRAAWVSALIVAALLSVPCSLLWLASDLWLGHFLDDAAAVAVGSQYLSIAAPAYVAFGFGLAWLFVAQATGALKEAFLASVARVLAIVVLAFALNAAGLTAVQAAAFATAIGAALYAILMPLVHRRSFDEAIVGTSPLSGATTGAEARS